MLIMCGARPARVLGAGGADAATDGSPVKRFLHISALVIACLISLTSDRLDDRDVVQDQPRGDAGRHDPPVRRRRIASYTSLFTRREFGHYFTNALIVTSGAVGIALVIGSLAAYALARFRLKFGIERRLAFVLLIARMLPTVVLIVPIYILTQKLGLLDTRIAPDHHLRGVRRVARGVDDGQLLPRDPGRPRGGGDGRRRLAASPRSAGSCCRWPRPAWWRRRSSP